jgi:predicted amidophosphoribosyltransferase
MSWATVVVATAVVVMLLLLWTTAWQHRRHASQTEPRLCPSCGTSHPPFARFCRQCGRQL